MASSKKYERAEAYGMSHMGHSYDQTALISLPTAGGGEPENVVVSAGVQPPGPAAGSHVVPMRFTNEGFRERRVSAQAIDIVVYFPDNHGLKFKVEDATNLEAGELFEMVMEEKRLPDIAREVFSLWMVSDLLELQLKPNHIPFKLAAFWEELLLKYTCAKEEEIERDEPVIVFRRNVFYSATSEKQLRYQPEHYEIFRFLYHEAKENVVDGRYTVNGLKGYNQEDVYEWYDELAGIQALLEEESFNQYILNPDYYSKKLKQYYPAHMSTKRWWKIDKSQEPHHRLFASHGRQFKRFGDLRGAAKSKLWNVYQKYLEQCWKLPYYGAAFFHAQIEHPRKLQLTKNIDDPVWVAINTSGIYIIDMDDVVFLMGLLFSGHFTWNFAEPNNQNTHDSKDELTMPCIFFQFEDKECSERGCQVYKKVLQVFSRESKSIDGLLDACFVLRKEKLQKGEDVVDADLKRIDGYDQDHVIESNDKQWSNFQSRALTSFDKHGKVLKTGLKTVRPPISG